MAEMDQANWKTASRHFSRISVSTPAAHVLHQTLQKYQRHQIIQQVMGHADYSTTMDIYTHITRKNMQEKAKDIGANLKLM